MFPEIKRLLKNFGFQTREVADFAQFCAKARPDSVLCRVNDDHLLWYIPHAMVQKQIDDYGTEPFFNTPPQRVDSEDPNRTAYRFEAKITDHAQLVELYEFLGSGFVNGFYVNGAALEFHPLFGGSSVLDVAFGRREFFTEAELDAALATAPDDAMLINFAAKVKLQLGKSEEAARLFVKACEKEPHYAEPYSNMGALLWDSGERQKAYRLFTEAVLRNPFEATFQDNFIKAGTEVGDVNSMYETVQNVQNFYPQFDGLNFLCAVLSQRLGKTEECIQRLRSHLEKHPDDQKATHYLAEVQAQ